jgi:peptidoglycan/xylan/chitin deacetylase (PgdA/CDA1 family)
VSALGYLNVRWTVDSLGWKGTSGGLTKDAVKEKVLKSAGNGAIVLMHLGSNPDDKTQLDSEALPEIITELRAEGYGFTTLSQLLESSRPNP